MNQMNWLFAVALSYCLFGFASTGAQEWQSLFDGKTLAGWKASETPGSFKIKDGCIAGDGARSHLFYVGPDGKADFRNFELSVEVMTRNGANSGLYFHTEYQPQGWPERGFEGQVLNVRGGAGDYIENKLTGSLYGLRNVYKAMAKDDEWFTMNIVVRGKRIQIRVNDVLLVDYVEPALAPAVPEHAGRRLGHGTFALQCHDPGSKVFYRNLRVKRLPDDLPEAVPAASPLTGYDQEIIQLGAANYPVVNYHVHLKGGLTLEEALAASRQTGVFYGIAVNCGLGFPVTNDAGIYDYLKAMRGQPAFVAMQAEGREWVDLFSKEAVAQFDYVFTDAMTIFDDNGRRMRLWITNEVPEIKDKQAFMDMLVDRTVKILTTEPIDILVNPTFLPETIATEYDQLWTEERMDKVIAAAAKRKIAIEINSRYRLPSVAFVKRAKAAGCRFTFGTNNADRDVGRLEYSFQVVKEADLRWQDIWTPPNRTAAR
jgi:hypothetical protein